MTEPSTERRRPNGDPRPRPLDRRDFSVRARRRLRHAGLALVAAWIGGFWFMSFWFVAAALALWEWQRLIDGERLWARIGVGVLTLLAVAPLALHGAKYGTLAAMAAGAVAAGAAAGRSAGAVWTGAGVFYAAAILAARLCCKPARHTASPPILWLFAVVWGADTFASSAGG